MSAVLWSQVRVFADTRELVGEARTDVAKHLKCIQSFSAWAGRHRKTPEQEESDRKQVEASFDYVRTLTFRDAQRPDSYPPVHWQDVVFSTRRTLDEGDFIRMNLPSEFWNKYEVPESIRAPLQTYGRQFESFRKDGAGLYLYGPSGCGKSSAAAAVAQLVRSMAYTVFFVTISDLREMIRGRIEFDEGQNALDRCKRVDLLVLDNVRAEDAKEMFVGALTLEDLMRARSSFRRPTIITSRLGPSGEGQLAEALPGFKEIVQASCAFLQVTGKNLRVERQKDLKSRLGLVSGK